MNNFTIDTLISKVSFLCEKNNTNPNQLGMKSGAGKNFVDNLKKGSFPAIDKVYKIAEYFGCSVDYLLGRTDSPNSITNGDISNSSVAQANGNNNQIRIQSKSEHPYSEIIEHLDSLSPAECRHAIADLMDVLENQYPIKKK